MENKYFCFLLIYFFVKREKGHSELVKHFYFTCMFDLFSACNFVSEMSVAVTEGNCCEGSNVRKSVI